MFVEINQAPIYVNVQGQGEPALLLHGVPDSAEIWDEVIAGIQSDYQCFAPDLPGFHRSGMPQDFVFSLDHYADFVDTLVDKLELKTPLTLVLHDWGGIFGMLWAAKYPHKVKRIIGGDFPFSHLYKWHEWATIWRTPLLGELSMLFMNWPLFWWEIKRGSRRLSKAQIKHTYEGKVTKFNTRMTVLKLYRSANPSLFNHWSSKQEQLAKSVPIDLVWGADDPYVSTDQAKLMHPRSVTVVDNCGHWSPQEAPEAFVDCILNGPGMASAEGFSESGKVERKSRKKTQKKPTATSK